MTLYKVLTHDGATFFVYAIHESAARRAVDQLVAGPHQDFAVTAVRWDVQTIMRPL